MEFQFLTSPQIIFGSGAVAGLGDLLAGLGRRPLLVQGGASDSGHDRRQRLEQIVSPAATGSCASEPTAKDVDRVVAEARDAGCDVVVAAGGGSVLDCGKAASAMMTNPGSLVDYLEGVGTGRAVEQPPCPMVAIPTTAGTGSEVTKNAVISGPGYKKSVRSPMMIPRVALVDPELTRTMPAEVTASCGMDALIQLMEAYLSSCASPITDGLALQGVELAGWSLPRAHHEGDDMEAREAMALASLLGGICLANAGLGAVHGFASPLGAYFPIPHGVACAALLPQVMEANLRAARGTDCESRVWTRFARLMQTLTGQRNDVETGLEILGDLQKKLQIPRLGEMGITENDFPRLVAGARGSSMKFNPVELDDQQLTGILAAAL